MRKRILGGAATLAAGALVLSAAPAHAQQDGLVNVNVGDITILEDVEVGVAANVVALICGTEINAAVIAEQVVTNNEPLSACNTPDSQAVVSIVP